MSSKTKQAKMEPTGLWPYIPTQPEWNDLPWERGEAALTEAFGERVPDLVVSSSGATVDSTRIGFIGHSETRFYFQRRGFGCVGILKVGEGEPLVFRAEV